MEGPTGTFILIEPVEACRNETNLQPSNDDANDTKRVSFHGGWSQERNDEILAGVAAIGRDNSSIHTLELKHVDFASAEFGDTMLSSLSRCRHLDLGMCLGSYLEHFVQSSLWRITGLQQLTFTGAVWNVPSFPACSSLKELCLENCRFESLKAIRELANGLNQCPLIETVKFAHCRLRDEHQ